MSRRYPVTALHRAKKPVKITVRMAKTVDSDEAVGLGFKDSKTIHIDPRQSPREFLDTLVHEALHIAQPYAHEDRVANAAESISAVLWKMGYRRKQNTLTSVS